MKRIISFVLCLSMLVSVLPVSAFAAQTEETVPETTVTAEAPAEQETEAPDDEIPEETEPAETEPEETEPQETEPQETEPQETEPAVTVPGETEPEETVPVETEAEETVPEETEPEVETAELSTLTGTVDLELDSDKLLFAAYTHAQFTGEELTTFGTAAGDRLTGDRKLAYDALAKLISQVASGQLDTGVLTIGHNLGKVSVGGVITTYTPMEEVAFTGSSFVQEDLIAVMDALLSDMPYELYWFDKTVSYKAQPLVTGSGKMFLTFSLCVSADFSATGTEGTYDVDTGKTGAASAAAENAGAIVAEFEDRSDLEILTGYKDRICQLTDYNRNIVTEEDILDPELEAVTPYGHPWQLIHVFDGDSATKVVCEGYAKAFQYLCDRTETFDADIACESVTGSIPEGRHMWNIVTIDGANYLVDVTNCDTGFDLFLAGGSRNSDGSYTFDGVTFAYGEDTLANWGDELLVLADGYYNEETTPEDTAMSGAELQELVADLTGQYVLTEDVVVTEDLELTTEATLFVQSGHTLTVRGATLTVACNLIVNDGNIIAEEGGALVIAGSLGLGYGTLTVAEGAEVTVDGSFALGGGASVTVDGTLTNNNWLNVGMGTLTVGGTYVPNSGTNIQQDVYGTVSGNVDKGCIDLESTLYGLENLEAALAQDHEGYAAYTVKLSSPMGETGPSTEAMVLEGDITIPEGVTVQLNAYTDQTDTLTLVGSVTVDGGLTVMTGGVLNVTGTLTVNGGLTNFGTVNNEGTILMAGSFQNDGTFTGNEPVELTALEKFLMALETAQGDVTIWDNIVLEEDLEISIPGTLMFADYASLEVPQGVTLTVNSNTAFNGARLQVTGKVINNADLSFSAANSEGHFIVDGYFENYGTCWINDGADMNVNYNNEELPGQVISYGTMHIGFGRGGSVNLNGGSFEAYGYLNVVDTISISSNGDSGGYLYIGGVHTFEDGTGTNGFLQAGGSIYVNEDGCLDVAGGLTLGNDETGYALIEIAEGGEMRVSADVMWCDILETGTLRNYGTLNNEGTIGVQGTFENYGTVDGNMPMDAAGLLIAQLTGDGDVVISESIALDEDFDINAKSVTINNGATLTLNGTVNMGGDTGLYVDGEGSALEINGVFIVGNNESYFTNGAQLIVNGEVASWEGLLEIGSEDSYGYVCINGSMIKDGDTKWEFHPGSSLLVNKDATLILNADSWFKGSELVVNGTLINYGNLEIRDFRDINESNGVATINGTLENYGDFWNMVGAECIINGNVINRGPFFTHVDAHTVLNGTFTSTSYVYVGYYGGGGTMDINDGGVMTVYSYLHAYDTINVNQGGELIVGGIHHNDDGSQTIGGNLIVYTALNVHGAMTVLGNVENTGSIHVSSGAELTVHEDGLLENAGDEGWQQDDGLNRGHLFIQGAVNINGTLDNYGYIGVGETVENPDPYAGGPKLYVGRGSYAGRLVNHAGGALDVLNNGTLEVDGEIENHDPDNGICNDGLFWLNGIMHNYGHFYNGGHLHIYYFHPGHDVVGELVIHEGTTLDNFGNVFLSKNGILTVDGELKNRWNDDESHGCVHLDGYVYVNGSMHVIGDLHIPESGDRCHVTVGENGSLTSDNIFIHNGGTLVNNGTVEYNGEFVLDEGGSFEGNEPVSKGFERLMEDFAYAVENGEGVGVFDGTVIVPEGEHTFPALAEGCELGLIGSKLVVPGGATLILDCPVGFYGGELIVEEGGSVISSVNLSLAAQDGDYSKYSTAVIDGELISNGSIWMVGCSQMTVDGYLRSSDAMHVGFDGGAALTINGTVDSTGYLNLVPDYDSRIHVGTDGVLNIGIDTDENGGITNVGFLQAGNQIDVDGTLNLNGFAVLGTREYEGGDVTIYYLNVNEGGVLNIEALYGDPRASLTLLTDGRVNVRGTLKQSGDSFLVNNGGCVEFQDNGVYDESAGFGYIENQPAQGAPRGLYYGWLDEKLPRDRITVFGYAESMENIYKLLAAYEEGGYQHGAIVVNQDFTLYEDLDLPEGMALLVEGGEEEPVTFEIAQGITLTTRQNVHIYGNGEIVNNGVFNIAGTMEAFPGHRLENNGEIAVTETGTMTLREPVNCEGSGYVAFVFKNAEEYGRVSGIPMDALKVVNPYAASQQEIQATLDFGAENGCHEVYVFLNGDITLTNDLVIPDNGYIQSHGVFTVPENVTVTNNGDFFFTRELVVNGSWVGNAPYGSGSLTGPGSYMTQEQLEQLLAEAAASGEEAWLNWNLILEENLELNQPLSIAYTAYMEIPEGVTLTIGEEGALTVYGELAADNGGKIVNNGLFRCELNGYAHMAEDTYTAGENGVLLTDYIVGWIADLIGPAFGEQTLHMANCTMEEELRSLINWVQDKAYKDGIVNITWEVTLSEDLVIPENIQIIISEYGSLIVPEGITLTNNGSVENNGRLAINGTWEGKPWIGSGEVIGTTQTVTQQDFLRMMDEAEDTVELNAVLTLTEDLELTKALNITKYGKLIVPEGITLTNAEYIDVYGTLLVEEGATLHNGNSMIWTDVGGNFLMYGQYIGETENWNIQREFDGYEAMANIEGIGPEAMSLFAGVYDQDQMQNLIDRVQSEGYCAGAPFIRGNMAISSDLNIPENVYVELSGSRNDRGDWEGFTVVVEEGVTVRNDGTFVVGGGCILVVNGQWEGNDPYLIEDGSLEGSFFYMSQGELEAMLEEEGEVHLKKTVVLDHDMVLNGQLYLEDFGHLVVPEGIRLEVNGLLETNYTGHVTVEGTLYNAGMINVHMDGVIDVLGGNYEQEDWGYIKLALWGENGDRSSPAILGVPSHLMSVTVDGNDEALIREAFAMNAKEYGIHIYRDMTLSRGLYLPANAAVEISGAGEGEFAVVTVPYGTTLTVGGRLTVGLNGALIIEGKLAGNLPVIGGVNARVEYGEDSDLLYTQEDLMAELQRYAGTNEAVTLSVDLELNQDLTIPEGVTLLVSKATLTVPKGRTLTANGWLDLNEATLKVEKGGTVVNNCGLSAMMGSRIDLTEGTYVHGTEWARVHQHFENHYDQYGDILSYSSTVVNIPYEHIAMYFEGMSEDKLQTFLLLADALQPMEINVEIRGGEMSLSQNTTIPENATVTIRSGTLVVPNGITLTNNGVIHIDTNGTFIVRSRGKLAGYQPLITSVEGAQYINEALYTEAQLRSDIAAAALSGREIFLSSDMTLTADLEIPENVIITLSGCTLEVPGGVTLTNHGELWVWQDAILEGTGGTLINDGLIAVREWGQMAVDTAENYQPTGNGEVREVYYGDARGNESYAAVDNLDPSHITVVAEGCSENIIRTVLDRAAIMGDGLKSVEINLTEGELRLSDSLTIPGGARMNIRDGGTLVVPEGVTLENLGFIGISNGGHLVLEPGSTLNNPYPGIEIYWDGHVHIQKGAVLNGSHPGVMDHGAEYINENVFGQDDLERMLNDAVSGTNICMVSQSVMLERDLVIPEGVTLLFTGHDNFLMIPEGITVFNEGFLMCHMFGGILGQGGQLVNRGEIRALNWGVVDMQGGTYTADGGMVYNHHWAYLENDNISHPTVLVPPSEQTFEVEGDNEYILHELSSHVRGILEVGQEPAGFNAYVTGHMRLTSDLWWEGCGYLRINEGCSLTVAEGATLYVYGILDIQGQLIVEEGGRVVAYRPIEIGREDAIINNSGQIINSYDPQIPLERFGISAEQEEVPVGTRAGIRLDVVEPVNANVVDFLYEITQGQAELFIETYGQGPGPILASRCDSVSIQPTAPGAVTVRVTPVVGYEENGDPILSERSDTVTVTVPERFIAFKNGEKRMDVLLGENNAPGVYAGSRMEFQVFLKDAYDYSDLDTDQLQVYVIGDPANYVTVTEENGLYTLAVSEDVAQRTEVQLVMAMADGSAVPNIMTVTLIPAARSVEILRDQWTVTGETVYHDLTADGWNVWLQPSAVPADALLTNAEARQTNGGQMLRWFTSDPDIATVDENGEIFFQGGLGDVTITMEACYDRTLSAAVTFRVLQLPEEITGDPHNRAIIGGSSLELAVTDLYTGEYVDNSLVSWTLCDRFGNELDSHSYASVTEEGLLTTRPVADETIVYLMAETVTGKQLVEPVPVSVYPEVRLVQILDVNGDPINGKHLLYDLPMMGGTYQLSWNAVPYAGAVEEIRWTSDNTDVAHIDENGLIHATGAHGDVNFTLVVTDVNGNDHQESFRMTFGEFTTGFHVTAQLPGGDVIENPEHLTVGSGDTVTLTAESLNYHGRMMEGADIAWAVSDENVASIRGGVLKVGKVSVPTEIFVTLRSQDQFTTWQIPVTVLPEPVETDQGTMNALVICTDFAFLTGSTYTMGALSGDQLYAVDAGTGEYVDVTWSSSNEDLAYVYEDGWAETYEENGTVTITAEDGFGRESSFSLKIGKRSEYVEITSENGSYALASGDQLQLKGTVRYSDGTTDENVTWTMTDAAGRPVEASVAAIDGKGLMTAAQGLSRAVTVTVWATPADGNPLAEEAVSVTIRPAATGVEICSADGDDITNTTVYWDIADGGSLKLGAMVYPYLGSNYPMSNGNALQSVLWSSSDENVATVAPDGTVTCIRGGRTTVTATAGSTQASVDLVLTKLMDTLELPADATVMAGEALDLKTLEGFRIDTQAENQTLVWSMTLADETGADLGTAVPDTVAALSEGIVTAGELTETRCILVRAASADGSGLTAQCFVTIEAVKPVTIVRQPVSVTVANGERAEVTLEAAGDGLTYRWYYRNAGASKFSLTTTFDGPLYFIEMSEARDGREVYCVVTDRYGYTATTETVSLNMLRNEAEIVKQPVSVTVASGEKATVSFEATGDGLTYTWYFRNAGDSKFSKTTSFTSNSYSVTMSADRNGREVYCVVTDQYGNKAKTNVVTLNMIINKVQIVKQPANVEVMSGENAVVTVEATGDGLTYKWYYKNAGASKFSLTTSFTGPTYTVEMSAARSGRQVYCVITDAYGNKAQTDTVTLTMKSSILILQQPVDVSVASGKTAEVTVVAEGEGLTYEWYFKNADGTKFSKTSSFTGPTYSVTMSASRSGRQVYCVITDADGASVRTDTVTLTMAATQLAILKQPTDVAVRSGETAAVTVEAEGDGLTYAWYYCNAGGSKFSLTTAFDGPTYSVTMSAARSGRQVYCVITDAYGNEVRTDTVTLSLASAAQLVIVQQPVSVTVANGQRAEVTVIAEGEGLTYEWFYANAGSTKFTKTSSFTGNSYYITMNADRSGRRVYCIITDADGTTVQTDTVTLSMAASQLAITKQPVDVTVALGAKAEATVEATGEGLSYEWFFCNPGSDSFSKTASFTGPTYSVTMSAARSGRRVYCVITDADGNSVTSDTVTLSMIRVELAIVKQPVDVTVASGETAEVTVEATGEGLTYQWYFMNAGGSKFSLTTAFTGNTYSVTMSAARSGRQVYCVITDVDGNTVRSDTVTLNMA